VTRALVLDLAAALRLRADGLDRLADDEPNREPVWRAQATGLLAATSTRSFRRGSGHGTSEATLLD
jgi:hypothetical protein